MRELEVGVTETTPHRGDLSIDYSVCFAEYHELLDVSAEVISMFDSSIWNVDASGMQGVEP